MMQVTRSRKESDLSYSQAALFGPSRMSQICVRFQ